MQTHACLILSDRKSTRLNSSHSQKNAYYEIWSVFKYIYSITIYMGDLHFYQSTILTQYLDFYPSTSFGYF